LGKKDLTKCFENAFEDTWHEVWQSRKRAKSRGGKKLDKRLKVCFEKPKKTVFGRQDGRWRAAASALCVSV